MPSKSENRSYLTKTLKLLYGNAAGRCTKCKCPLILKKESNSYYQIGEVAHIYPFGENGAPRYTDIEKDHFNPNLKNDERNLILLCPKCHKEVDGDPEKYSAPKLLKMKEDHRNEMNELLSQAFSDINYKELDIICKAIINCGDNYNYKTDYSAINIEEKIKRNELSEKTRYLVMLGMQKAQFVHEYLNVQTNVTFAEDLLKYIKNIYHKESKKYQGDELFAKILEQMNAGIEQDISKQAAGISVLTYFFHICEVFKK